MSPAKRGPYRKSDNAKKKLRIKEYVPPNARKNNPTTSEENTAVENAEERNTTESEDENQNKKKHGSWTDEKELALMCAYVSIFPPAWRRGTVSDGWRKVIDQVNAVAPNDTPLEYDACRRNVDRIINNYKSSSMSGGYKYQKEMEEAASSALRKREAHEGVKGKRSKRAESEAHSSQKRSNEAQENHNSVPLDTQDENNAERSQTEEELDVDNQIENRSPDEVNESPETHNKTISFSEFVRHSSFPAISTPTFTLESQLLEEQRQFQKSMLNTLDIIANSSRNTEKLLEKMLLHFQNNN